MLSTQSSGLKRTLNMCSLDPGSCSLVTQACNMDTRIQSAVHTQTHILSPPHKYTHTHIHKPPTPAGHNSHPSLPRISCSPHIMLKWTCIIALAWLVVFVGSYQQPPWSLWQRWSLLQAPQIYIRALTNMLFLWGPIVKMECSGFRGGNKCNLSNYIITAGHMFLRYR